MSSARAGQQPLGIDSNEAAIIGWAHSPLSKLDDPDVESLIERVAGADIEKAGLDPDEIDGVFVGVFNSGFSRKSFPASLSINIVPNPALQTGSQRQKCMCDRMSGRLRRTRFYLCWTRQDSVGQRC